MPHYLIRFGYTPDTWAALIKNPEDRREAARALIEEAGGTLQGFWYSFGDQDGFVLVEGPNNVSAAAVSVAVAASGRFRSIETTVLITVEEMLDAFRKAQGLPYRPPGG